MPAVASRALALIAAVAFLLTSFVPTGAAHEPEDEETPAFALLPDDDIDLDGVLDEEAWEDWAEDHEIEFDSAEDGDVRVWFLWSPADEKLYIGITVEDGTDDAGDDYVDLAFSPDHDADDADDSDQTIYRIKRSGDCDDVSVEDLDDIGASCSSDLDFDVLDDPGDSYVIEASLDWTDDQGELSGWMIAHVEDGDDNRAEVYPDGAELDDPRTWADVLSTGRPVPIDLGADKTALKVGNSVNLTATIDDRDVDLGEHREDVIFERSLDDGETWTEVDTEEPDDDGVAETTIKLTAAGSHSFRAKTDATDEYAEGVSEVVVVAVAERGNVLYRDDLITIRWETQDDQWRNYTLIANVSDDEWATWEVSATGHDWVRLATGTEGVDLVARWVPPTTQDWEARAVLYDEDGKASVGDAHTLTMAQLPRGTKTATELTVEIIPLADGRIRLNASVDPKTATGTVVFFRAPGQQVGTAQLSGGTASVVVTKPLPGLVTYAARYSGASTFGPSSGRATLDWWPATTGPYAPRAADSSGEAIALTATASEVSFAARRGDGPGLPGAIEVTDTYGGATTVVYRGNLPSGALATSFEPAGTGAHTLTATFYRPLASGGVVADQRLAAVDVKDVAVSISLTVPATARVGEEVEAEATFLDAAGAPLVVGAGTVKLQLLEGSDWITKREVTAGGSTATLRFVVPDAVGEHRVRAAYGGASGFLAATSETHVVDVEAAQDGEDDGDGDGGDDGGAGGDDTPAVQTLGVLAALAAAVLLVRRRS